MKYLGVILDDTLTFHYHLDAVISIALILVLRLILHKMLQNKVLVFC